MQGGPSLPIIGDPEHSGRWQSMTLTRAQALCVACLYGAAGAGAQIVNPAGHLLADLSFQCDAVRAARRRALHASQVGADGLGQCHRHRAAWGIIGFRPVKRNPVLSAASAAGLAVKRSAHTLTGPNAVARSGPCAPKLGWRRLRCRPRGASC